MKSIRTMGLCLVAVFAISAFTAASASAAPGWYMCGPAGQVTDTYKHNASSALLTKNVWDGQYKNSTCTLPGPNTGWDKPHLGWNKQPWPYTGPEGHFEIVPGIGSGSFHGTSGSAVLHTVVGPFGDVKVECTMSQDTGKLKLPNLEFKVMIVYKGCEALATKCQNVSQAGIIKVGPLEGKLGEISPGIIGIDLTNEPPTPNDATFTCTGAFSATVTGSVIGVQQGDISPPGWLSKPFTVVYAPGPKIGSVIGSIGGSIVSWTPLVNIPQFAGGPTDILQTELCGPLILATVGNNCVGGALPSGLEQTTANIGPNLMVK